MADLVYVAVVVAFFVVAALYVVACDRVIGPDPDDLTVGGIDDDAAAPVVRADDMTAEAGAR